ncbi:MAG: ABC transporter ATP-binding protein/permease [Thermomicrobiales bacterium]|nr:ABC transporter ATP-binding protein/permease [Thermomicrobiales bacterium]
MQILRRVIGIFRPYRAQVGAIMLAILVSSGIGLANPLLLRRIIDDAIPNGDMSLLNILVALMILAPILGGLVGVGQSYLSNRVGQSVMRDLRMRLYSHLQGMSLRFFTGTRTGEIQSRLSNDVGGVQGVLTNTAASIVSNIATVLTTVVAMSLISGKLTLLSFALLPIALYLTQKVGRTRRRLSTQTQRTMADMSSMVEETLSVSGVLLTKTFGRQTYEIDRFGAENDSLASLQLHQQMVGRWYFMIIGTFFSIAPAVAYWLAGRAIIGSGSAAVLTIGDLVAFTTLQARLFFPLGALLNVQVEIQGALALFERIFDYLDRKQEIVDASQAIVLDPHKVEGRVVYDDVFFRYGTGDDGTSVPKNAERDWTLQGVSFEGRPGQLIALVGPSGAGKTTLTYLLPRLYDVASGSVSIDGHDVRDISLASLGEIIGAVTQETHLSHTSIRENLRYGRPDATDDELIAAARAAAIHDRIMELEDGYDTVVGERGYRLSGGEKQRLAIARVILKDPRILILDEATSALDTRSERLIQSALEPLMQSRTTIAIAHRLSTILAADLILVIDGGQVVERGTHDELLVRGGLYSRLYHEQFAARPELSPTVLDFVPAADD